jgi:site-specific recombinase XerD
MRHMDPPRFCIGCQRERVAWMAPRVDYCYRCLPGGPFTAPPCLGCASTEGYFSQGLCISCHPASPKARHSCKDCLAWGVLAKHNFLCWGCRYWRTRLPVGRCPYCGRQMPLGDAGACRLCWRQALHLSEDRAVLDFTAANRCGQQLFLANMEQSHGIAQYRLRQRRAQEVRALRERCRSWPAPEPFAPVRYKQYPLVWIPGYSTAKAMAEKRLATAPSAAMDRHLHQVLREHASKHGWSVKQSADVHLALRALQATQATVGALIAASEVEHLGKGGLTVQSTLEVLLAAGLLDDDRIPRLRRLFDRLTRGLPPAMLAQLETWYRIMVEGSTRPPRRKPRDPGTVRNHLYWITPALHAWADEGFDTLAAIDSPDVLRVLPAAASRRTTTSQGLRNLFAILKADKLIFANPMSRITPGHNAKNIPLPLDTAAIRTALNDPNPVKALAVALVAFHGLSLAETHRIQLTDLHDGRLQIGGRSIPLAEPVRARLNAYLTYRARTWPDTRNPHLLINRRSAPRTRPVGVTYPWMEISIKPQALREDRILGEILATGGDIRRICDLFGMSVAGALRYTTGLEHPGLSQ